MDWKEVPVTDTRAMHDHFTVLSRAGGVPLRRIVIADSAMDAAETHRTHYPEGEIILVIDHQLSGYAHCAGDDGLALHRWS
ncbi:hypothetical protein DQP55_06085 [Mycolicibacterium sp. GF69]|nr:hypothetical protein DQP55_06085 [Mycolicibacterium sp. GF69]